LVVPTSDAGSALRVTHVPGHESHLCTRVGPPERTLIHSLPPPLHYLEQGPDTVPHLNSRLPERPPLGQLAEQNLEVRRNGIRR